VPIKAVEGVLSFPAHGVVPDGPFSWVVDAPCATAPDLFFPPVGQQTNRVRAVCEPGDAQTRCMAWAVVDEPGFEAWGGTTVKDRPPLRRERMLDGEN
jgi:hypothetical protein